MGGEYGILDRMVILINYFDLNHGDDQISIHHQGFQLC